MKLLAVLSVLFVAQGALAEVGTQNPKSVETTSSVDLALADQGASNSWSVEPLEFQATAHQTADLNDRVAEMNNKISVDLESLIAEKVESALAQ
ncbi:hypothetical protein [Agaribacterium sp. ZY112]|uniref:hypothetical protein n=1 Tax=Agaribacterium sp. ZY112 TaxID=3233574 RepID=UPI0035269CB3